MTNFQEWLIFKNDLIHLKYLLQIDYQTHKLIFLKNNPMYKYHLSWKLVDNKLLRSYFDYKPGMTP